MAAPNLLIVAQAGRLEFQAIIFAASLRHAAPDFTGRLIVAEPQPEGAWAGHDTRIGDDKIEALSILPPDDPFVFFDSDTLITGPLDQVPFGNRPAASMRREGTWPEPPPYGPGYAAIWKSLYDRFGLDFASSLDLSQPTSIGNAICISTQAGSVVPILQPLLSDSWTGHCTCAATRPRNWPAKA